MATVSLSWQTGRYQSVNHLLRHHVLYIVSTVSPVIFKNSTAHFIKLLATVSIDLVTSVTDVEGISV